MRRLFEGGVYSGAVLIRVNTVGAINLLKLGHFSLPMSIYSKIVSFFPTLIT